MSDHSHNHLSGGSYYEGWTQSIYRDENLVGSVRFSIDSDDGYYEVSLELPPEDLVRLGGIFQGLR